MKDKFWKIRMINSFRYFWQHNEKKQWKEVFNFDDLTVLTDHRMASFEFDKLIMVAKNESCMSTENIYIWIYKYMYICIVYFLKKYRNWAVNQNFTKMWSEYW